MGQIGIGESGELIPDLTSFRNLSVFEVMYHGGSDTLFLRPSEPRPATSIDWNGELWIRVDPATGEVVGLEIGDFETIFLKKHPDVATAWEEAKPRMSCWLRYPITLRKKTCEGEKVTSESFLNILSNFLMRLFYTEPYQAAFPLVA
jgi:uncharacterized protein YuzE